MGGTHDKAGGDAVASQYEDYPYPPRDPADEARRLVIGSPSHVLEISHYCFGGRRDWSKPFSALIAGGGTGDAAIMLASQLAALECPATVTYLDLSAASRAIAEARAARRGLTNIRFLSGSLLDVATIAPGPYDYIDCCGVLHHLPEPAAGLHELKKVLSPTGGMGLMLYGALGRTGVYPLQAALRKLTGDLPRTERVEAARQLLGSLPDTNWFKRNPGLGDHRLGDAALFDLLLHSQDCAFRVPELVALVSGEGMAITGLIEPLRYDPTILLPAGPLREKAAALPWLEQAALAEEISGTLKTHVFYLVGDGRAAGARAEPDDPALIPVLREADPRSIAAALSRPTMTLDLEGNKYRLDVPAGCAEIAALIDGKRSLRRMAKDLGLAWKPFSERFAPLYRLLNQANLLLLRA